MRPGLSRYEHRPGGVHILTVPGNPVSGFCPFFLFVCSRAQCKVAFVALHHERQYRFGFGVDLLSKRAEELLFEIREGDLELDRYKGDIRG
jgi:hypothetical protein